MEFQWEVQQISEEQKNNYFFGFYQGLLQN